ncbi:hypothetical protein GCM10008994_21100 [Halorubrum ejinorense]|uniref:NADP-dependent oxidoreductase domain-containing protein n=1 Tax=Halorubrum ejinorense TaxID=425309 RepID=A0AAV3SU07_9EURY
MVKELGLGLMPFSPLAAGFLAGKYERGESPPAGSRGAHEERFQDRYLTAGNSDTLETVEAVTEDLDSPPVAVSLAWLLAHPAVTSPVVGPRTIAQLEENLAAATLNLDVDTFHRLDGAMPAPY